MLDINGRWYPRLSPKQIEVYNDNRVHILLSGPRVCGKTIVAIHKIIRHAWLNQNDRVGIFVKSTKIGKTGVWDDLANYAIPEWEAGMADEGFKVTVPPSVDGATRMHYLRISNRHGGESEIQLHPLHFEDGVSEKLRGSRFGCIFFDELDNYDNPEVFNISDMQLRQIGLPESKHLWLATCNPAGDDSHWIHAKWYVDKFDETIDKSYRDTFALYDFKLADNIFLQPETITKLKMAYKNDPAMYDRYINGLWVPDLRSVIFAGTFLEGQHVKGDAVEGTIIIPTEHCYEIVVGWDIGDRNHAVTFLEHVITTKGDYWAVIEEISHIGEDVSIEALTYEVLAKMAEIRALANKPKLQFKHWSDRSAFDRYRSAADAKDHILVNRYSGGDITLMGCPKPPGSVQARLGLVRQLLVEKRLFFSAHCLDSIMMMKRLSKGKTKAEPIKRDAHIHRFDAMSYVLYAELIDEIEESMRPNLKQRPEPFSL